MLIARWRKNYSLLSLTFLMPIPMERKRYMMMKTQMGDQLSPITCSFWMKYLQSKNES
jgi:hypothetical protein